MSKTVYVFGAGINRCVQDWHGLRPPLATDFFQQALKHVRIGEQDYRKQVQPVFDYILHYWKLSTEQLQIMPFDLEECYTLLQLQSDEAKRHGEHDKHVKLLKINYLLTQMIAMYLDEIESFAGNSDTFRALGRILYTEKPAMLTFNYDTLLESVIESASGVKADIPSSLTRWPPEKGDVPDNELPYSHFNWNRPLAYGVQFDEIQLQRAGLATLVPGTRFYAHPENHPYQPPLLKLHGSLNWFVYSGIRQYPVDSKQQKTKQGQTLLHRGYWWRNNLADISDEFIEPLLITPVLHKNLNDNPLIENLWIRAREELSECHRLVIGGYSFPPTDFHTRRLFLESFAERPPEEIIVINPNTSMIGLVKRLCHFDKPVVTCRDLEEYTTLYNARMS